MASLRALECFLSVMRTGSVTRAAQELHLSQPALSHQLSVLEQEFGTTLFERLPRGVRPTAAAREMAADAQIAVDAAERAHEAVRSVLRGSAGRLRIGVAESMTAPVLAPVLSNWLKDRPEIQITLHEESSADVLNGRLSTGELDITIGPSPSQAVGTQTVLAQEQILVVMTNDHPLAKRRKDPTLAEVAAEPIVNYDPANGLRGWLEACAAREGLVLTTSVQTRQAMSAAWLAAAGLGLALVPSTALQPGFHGRLRRLQPRLTRDLVATHMNDHDALLLSFREALVAGGVQLGLQLTGLLKTAALS